MTAILQMVQGHELYEIADDPATRICLQHSAEVYVFSYDNKVVCYWGLIQPSMIDNRAYLWLQPTDHMWDHLFLVVRYSRMAVAEMLKDYPRLIGECKADNEKAIRWAKWCGGEFGFPKNGFVPFEIRAK